MVNYQNGKVYKIINENNEIIYIGSTSEEKLCKRYAKHELKAPNHKIILIENYSCNSREELRKREQEIIEEHSNLLNLRKAYCSEEDKKKQQKEYRENNKDIISQKNKKYSEDNKEQIKEYRENNKEKMVQYQQDYYKNNKNRIRITQKKYSENNNENIKKYKQKYYENNNENIKKYKQKYYENNKEEILKKLYEKVKCEFCGCESLKQNLKRHQKNKKCLIIQKDLKKS